MDWLKIGGIVGGLVLAVWLFNVVSGWKRDATLYDQIKGPYAALVEARKAANDEVKKQQPVDEARRAELAEQERALAAERTRLNREWQRLRATVEVPSAAENECPVVRLSDGWGVCFAAATGRDATDVAACQAGGGDGAAEPGAGG